MANFGSGVIILESDSGDNDDWITDHSGDPENVDASKFTEGLEHIYFNVCIKVKPVPKFDFADIVDIYQGSSLDSTFSIGHFEVEVEFKHSDSTFTNLENKLSNIQDFILNHSSSTQNDTYLVIRRGADAYFRFPDGSGTPGSRKKYLKGRIIDIQAEIDAKNRYISGKLLFRSVID